MHSRIFQVSKTPITKEDYADPRIYYDNSSDFADYIGDEIDDPEERKEDIQWLANALRDIFILDGEVLVYKGVDNFLSGWVSAIKEYADNLAESNILEFPNLFRLRRMTEETHKNCSFRFDISDWEEGIANPLSELIIYVKGNMHPGDKLYIGSVIDYHF